MFDSNRYLTCGIEATIPSDLQMFLWECVELMPAPKDYLQLFVLKQVGSMQSITHRSEKPEYHMEYLIPSDKPITQKIYVIHDDDHSTMLLATEY